MTRGRQRSSFFRHPVANIKRATNTIPPFTNLSPTITNIYK